MGFTHPLVKSTELGFSRIFLQISQIFFLCVILKKWRNIDYRKVNETHSLFLIIIVWTN